MANSGEPGFSVGSEGKMDFPPCLNLPTPVMSSTGSETLTDSLLLLIANSGQPGFSVGSEGEMDFPSYLNLQNPVTNWNPLLEAVPQNLRSPNMGTQFHNTLFGPPAGTSSGVVHDQHVTRINVSRTGTTEMTPKKTVNLKKKETDRAYRERQKQAKIQMQNELDKLRKENESSKHGLASMNETLKSQAEEIDQLKRYIAKALKSNNEMQNAVKQPLAKLLDLYPTQDPSPSNEKRHSEEEILAGSKHVVLDVDDSGDENDDSKKKRRAASSAPSGCPSTKALKLEAMNELMGTQVTIAAKKEWYDAGAERYGCTSYPTTKVDPYSITECLRILKSMKDIKYATVKKATAKFKSPEERETFVGLTDDWRKNWVKDLENDA